MLDSMLGSIYQKLMGIPFVYDKVRPFFLGGLDLGPFYEGIEAQPSDTILDIGCGTGNALDYLPPLSSYIGYDTDLVAIEAARRKWSAAGFASFRHGECSESDVREASPTRIILCGVLHHLPDPIAISLLQAAMASARFESIHTLDVAYFPGSAHTLSNVLARLDRGKFVRQPEGYIDLIERAGLTVSRTKEFWNDPTRRRAKYFTTKLTA